MAGRLEEWCIKCWKERRGKAKPAQAPRAEASKCFICGEENYDGIYVNVSPWEVEELNDKEQVEA